MATETTPTTVDSDLLTVLQSSDQLSLLFSNGQNNSQATTNNEQQLIELQEQMQSTNFPVHMTGTPQFTTIDHNRNGNEIFKFNPSINTGIDDGLDIDSTSDAPYVIPLKIILPVEHVHKSRTNHSFVRYNYILLKVDDITYHEHIPSDNSEILFPVDRQAALSPTEMFTSVPDSYSESGATTTTTTLTVTTTANVFDIDRNEHAINSVQNDIVLVDSQGYHYELSHHVKIMDEFETNVVEFDSITMVRAKDDNELYPIQVTKRILSDDDEQIDHEKNDINVTQYERHYAKIFQWLHYHL